MPRPPQPPRRRRRPRPSRRRARCLANDYAAAWPGPAADGRPVLWSAAGAVVVRWCKQLDATLADPRLQSELGRWACVYVDVESAPARGPCPGLRAGARLPHPRRHRPTGRVREDIWHRRAAHLAARPRPEPGSPRAPPPSPPNLPPRRPRPRLIADLDRADPAVRESPCVNSCSPSTVPPPRSSTLSRRATSPRAGALEILQEWGAPVPTWTLATGHARAARAFDNLRSGCKPRAKPPTPPAVLTDRQRAAPAAIWRAAVREDICPSEINAIRERLARMAPCSCPTSPRPGDRGVRCASASASPACAIALVASDELVFAWPGGLDRLAALDVQTRHAGRDDLARGHAIRRAVAARTVRRPDALVREIALRGLHKTGAANPAAVRLLADPEPTSRRCYSSNSPRRLRPRSPGPRRLPRSREGPRPVVHAIPRARSAKGQRAPKALPACSTPQLAVRARSAEGLGQTLSENGDDLPDAFRKTSYARLLEVLDDSDGFVVSVAVKALRGSPQVNAVDALARAADRHAEIAADVLEILGERSEWRREALPHLRRFCSHSTPPSCLAIRTLCTGLANDVRPNSPPPWPTLQPRENHRRGSLCRCWSRDRRRPTTMSPSTPGEPGAFSAGSSPPGPPLDDPSCPCQSRPPALRRRPPTGPVKPSRRAAAPPELSGNERWLAEFTAGTTRPKWMTPPLEPALGRPMLTAEAPDERALAAVILTAFGPARPRQSRADGGGPNAADLAGLASGAFPGCPGPTAATVRSAVGKRNILRRLHRDRHQPGGLVRPGRSTPLGPFRVPRSPTGGGQVLDLFRRSISALFVQPVFRAAGSPARAIAQACRGRTPAELPAVVALVLLIGASRDDAATQAGRILEDPKGRSLARDAFHVQLLAASSNRESWPRSDWSVPIPPSECRPPNLALGPASMAGLRGFSLYYETPPSAALMEWGRPIRVTAPRGSRLPRSAPC